MQFNPIINQLLPYTTMSSNDLLGLIEYPQIKELFSDFLSLLESAAIRVSHRCPQGQWIVNKDVKQLILLGFRLGQLVSMGDHTLSFIDKDTYPIRQFDPSQMIRLVPGGVSVRRGAHVATSVTIMPPSFINVGAFIGESSMIDSHALVGSCAQIGKRVHISSCAQIGGVLEPVGELPVIIEDDVFIGGNCGVYEGTQVGSRAVIGAGVILTRSTRVYDLINNCTIAASDNHPLHIPPEAVVVPGSRKIKGPFAKEHGLSLYTPLIVKYRDAKTDTKTIFEQVLR